MKRVLVVAYYFPPVSATGAMRPLGFCRYLEEYGWAPTVLTTSPSSVYPPHPVDEQLLKKLPEGVQVHIIPYSSRLDSLLTFRHHFRSYVSRFLIHTKKHPIAATAAPVHENVSAGNSPLSMAKRFLLDWLFSFPDPQCSWIAAVMKHVSSWPREQFPDAIFATGSPWTSLVIGRQLASRFEVPFLADFRDPWAPNAFYHYTSPYLIKKTKLLEESVCSSADWVIANTEELRGQFHTEYPSLERKCITLTNGFHRDDFGEADIRPPRLERNGPPSLGDDKGLELSHFGTMYMMRTPVVLLQALLELFQQGELRPKQITLRFVGIWDIADRQCEGMAQELEKHGFLKRDPPVSHRECLQQMVRADALLIMQSGSMLQVPAKIYEYIATGRPLLVIGDPGATFNLVERHQLGLCCANTVSAIKDMVLQLVTGRLSLSIPTSEAIAQFDYRVLTGRLAEALNKTQLDNDWCDH